MCTSFKKFVFHILPMKKRLYPIRKKYTFYKLLSLFIYFYTVGSNRCYSNTARYFGEKAPFTLLLKKRVNDRDSTSIQLHRRKRIAKLSRPYLN